MRRVVPRARARLGSPGSRSIGRWDQVRSPRCIKLDDGIGPTPLALCEPRSRQVAVLARLRFFRNRLVARRDEARDGFVVARQRSLGHEQLGFEFAPRILQALEDLEGNARVRLGGIEVVRIKSDHCKQSLAARFSSRILHLPKARSRGKRSGPRAREIEGPMVGMTEREVALGHAEQVSNAIEFGPCLRQEVAAPLEGARSFFDYGE
jgi:hypothetical protein